MKSGWGALSAGFLGWFCAGLFMSTTTLAMRSASLDLLDRVGTVDLARFQALNRSVQASQPAEGRARPATASAS